MNTISKILALARQEIDYVLECQKEIERLESTLQQAIEDLNRTDKCDICRNNNNEERFYDAENDDYYPRKYKCDNCLIIGGAKRNNFEWRGLNSK